MLLHTMPAEGTAQQHRCQCMCERHLPNAGQQQEPLIMSFNDEGHRRTSPLLCSWAAPGCLPPVGQHGRELRHLRWRQQI